MQKAEFLGQNLHIKESHFLRVAALGNEPRCSSSFPPALLPCQGSKCNCVYVQVTIATQSVLCGVKKKNKNGEINQGIW